MRPNRDLLFALLLGLAGAIALLGVASVCVDDEDDASASPDSTAGFGAPRRVPVAPVSLLHELRR
jgi:hypothetical protein